MADETEFLTGRAGEENRQGYSPMNLASTPVERPDDISTDSIMTEDQLRHFKRPEPPAPVEREYVDLQSGEARPSNETVPIERAADDLAASRTAERAERERQSNADMDEALRAHEAGREPQQPAQDQQPTAVDEIQPEHSEAERDAAHAEADAAWAKADAEISEFLKNPHIRERIQGEYDQIKQTAAAEAKQEVERAHNLSAAAQQHYQQATTNLLNEAGGIIGALYPELNGLSGEQLKGALQVMAQTNPQRVQQLQHLASRAQGLVEAQARQHHEAQRGRELQRDAALEQYTSANVKEYENWSARENPETMKSIRENLKPIVEKQYGVPLETLMAIHTGKMQMDATTFVRSAAFQKMLHNSIKYNLATRGVTEARSNPIPKVQRPGVAPDGPSDNNEYASLERQFRGKDLNPKQAADLLIAHRARR